MILKRSDFLQAVKFLKPAIGESEYRKSITVLNVELDTNGLIRLTGADAIMIKRVKIEMVKKSRFSSFSIPKNVLCVFEKICKLDKNIAVIELGKSVLKCGKFKLGYEQPTTEFPNLEKVLAFKYPKRPTTNFAGLNVKNIIKVVEGFKKNDKSVVKIWYKSDTSPFKITSQCGYYTAILMPVRINW